MPTNANEVRFPCPNCGLRLACEDGYGGWRIQCPGCNGGVVVPLRTIPAAKASLPSAQAPFAGRLRTGPAHEGAGQSHGGPETFQERFVTGFGQAFSGLVTGVVGVLAVFGLLVGGCSYLVESGQSRAGALNFSTMLVLCVVGGMLLVFTALWERMWR
ncbi:MAG: hypothetical protein ABMA26_18985 [Limisphaerales bacterium]